MTAETKNEERLWDHDPRYILGGARAIGRFVSKAGRGIYNAGHVWPGTTLFMPSIARKLAVALPVKPTERSLHYTFGVIAIGGVAFFTNMALFGLLDTNGWLAYDAQHFKETAITVAGFNAASLVYEIGRHVKIKAGLRKGSELEERVEGD